MKLKAIERILLILISLLLMGVSFLAFCIAWGFVSQDYLELIVRSIYSIQVNTWIITGGAAVVLILGIAVMITAFSSGKKEAKPYITISTVEGGTIKIAVKSLIDMVSRQVAQIDGVISNMSTVTCKDNKVGIIVKISISQEMAVPEVSKAIQFDVKEAVQALSGIDIAKVDVYVDNSLDTTKA